MNSQDIRDEDAARFDRPPMNPEPHPPTPDGPDALFTGKRARLIYPFDAPWKEAAWFLIKQFVHPYDWSKWAFSPATGHYAALPAHTNESFLSVIGRIETQGVDPFTMAPFSFRDKAKTLSRSMFDAHLAGKAKYFFRSKDFMAVRTGYQSYDAGFTKLPFDARLLGITGKVRKWPHLKMVMAVVDIDDKLGLGIAPPVCDWLTTHFFPNSYCEPSTSGKGVHVYLKLVMPRQTKIFHVRTWFNRFTQYLGDELAQWLQQEDNPLVQVIKTDFSKLSENYKVKSLEEVLTRLAHSTIDKIAGLPTCFDEQGKLRRGQCIRLPRFPNGWASVLAFSNQPVLLFDLWKEVILHPREATGLLWSSCCVSNSVSPTGRTPSFCEDLELVGEAPEEVYERTHSFLMKRCREVGRILSVEEGMEAYEQSGIPKDFSETERIERRYRVVQALKHIARSFDPEKIKGSCFDFSLKQDSQRMVVDVVFEAESSLTYKDGVRIRKVKREELALVYTLFRNNLGKGYKSGFSVQMVQRILAENGFSKARKVAQAVRDKLVGHGFLTPAARAIAGVRGTVYTLGQPTKRSNKVINLGEMERQVEEIVGWKS